MRNWKLNWKSKPKRSLIYNRSYYEGVLILRRMHPEVLRAKELPDTLLDESSI